MITSSKKRFLIGAVLTTLIIIGLVLLLIASLNGKNKNFESLKVNGRIYQLELATTPAERTKGLSGRSGMPADRGLLFIFENSDKHCFWMKDMKFSIDMIWLDEQKKVVHIQESVSPDTYPKTFCSPEPARYVIEVNAGVGTKVGLKLGQTLTF